MDKDKQIQKVPKYSIDRIAAKSALATRGLRELGLLKEEKHFTIIYVCQFCGRLINYSSTPCIFCGNFPKTKRDVIVAQALSSESIEIDSLLVVSKSVKDQEDLEISISNLRNLIDEILKNPSKFKNYEILFKLTGLLLTNPEIDYQAQELVNKTKIICDFCNNKIVLADKACFFCATNPNISVEDAQKIENNLSPIQKHIVALNGFLLFVENYLDFANDKSAMTELIFVSVYLLNRLIEKDELPGNELKKYWHDLLLQSEYFGSDKNLHSAVRIGFNGKTSIVYEENGISRNATFEIIQLAENLIYLLES